MYTEGGWYQYDIISVTYSILILRVLISSLPLNFTINTSYTLYFCFFLVYLHNHYGSWNFGFILYKSKISRQVKSSRSRIDSKYVFASSWQVFIVIKHLPPDWPACYLLVSSKPLCGPSIPIGSAPLRALPMVRIATTAILSRNEDSVFLEGKIGKPFQY